MGARDMRAEWIEKDLQAELKKLREDIDHLIARMDALDARDHFYAVDEAANDLAGMTGFERNYFAHEGKSVPTGLLKLSDWWRKFRLRHGF